MDDLLEGPGYRRLLRIEPGRFYVLAMLEDDLHCMAVRLRHDGARVVAVEPLMERAPWTICHGAAARLIETFAGAALVDVTARAEKQQNCTHLHDLAVFAAAHAHDAAPVEYAIFASDPVEGERSLAIYSGGMCLHHWTERRGILASPSAIAGRNLLELRDWIAGLAGQDQEAARMLQWASLVAHGRAMSAEQRRASIGHRPSCYAFQPERAPLASPGAPMLDFSDGSRLPLDGFADRFAAAFGEAARGSG